MGVDLESQPSPVTLLWHTVCIFCACSVLNSDFLGDKDQNGCGSRKSAQPRDSPPTTSSRVEASAM